MDMIILVIYLLVINNNLIIIWMSGTISNPEMDKQYVYYAPIAAKTRTFRPCIGSPEYAATNWMYPMITIQSHVSYSGILYWTVTAISY